MAKPYGFVLDFVGIFENLEKALAFDSDVVASVIQNIDVLRGLFATLMRERASNYLPLARGRDDKAKERAVVAMEDKEKREAFFKFFRQVQSLYDILSPDAFLRPYIEDYQALAVLYAWIRQAYSDRVYVDREFTRKTKDLLQQHTQSGILEPPTVVYEIGQPQLLALRESSADDTVKVLNLRKLIAAAVENEGGIRPYLLSIGERAQVLAEAYENRQISTKEALERFEALVQETVDANAKRRRLDVDENTFAIYTALQVALPGVEAVQARAINALFRRYPDYKWNTGQESALRAELYRMLLPIVGTAQMVAVANILLRLEWV
jgi:type I restriction enzyme R subunit